MALIGADHLAAGQVPHLRLHRTSAISHSQQLASEKHAKDVQTYMQQSSEGVAA
jgi:hypothetical protein